MAVDAALLEKKETLALVATWPIVILGCGSMGKKRLRFLQEWGCKNLTAVDLKPDRRQEVKEQFKIAVSSEFEETLKKVRPKVVFIATSTAFHLKPALAAAKQGCHMLIEKPLSDTLAGLDSLQRIVRRKRLKVLTGCNLRFHPSLSRIQKLVADGRVGKVVCVRFQSGMYLPDWHPWEDYRQGYSANKKLGGGVILDGIQALDFPMWLVGRPVQEVFSFAGKLTGLEIDTEDTAEILLKFREGTIAEVHLDYVQRAPGIGCQVIGEEGSVFWDGDEKAVKLFTAKTRRWETFPDDPRFDYSETFWEEMKHFLRCITDNQQPSLDLPQAVKVLEIALAAKESAERGKCIRLK